MRPPFSLTSHLLVLLQFSGIGLCIASLVFHQQPANLWTLCISAIGVLVGIYTLAHNRLGNFGIYPEPLAEAQLITTGPYHWIRHPMYTSLLLALLGIALIYPALLSGLGMLCLITAILGKIHKEEKYLVNKFEGYAEYAKNTKRLIPYLF